MAGVDWWAYVEFPDGPMPKFELPWWVQVPISVDVGCFWGGVGHHVPDRVGVVALNLALQQTAGYDSFLGVCNSPVRRC